MDPLPIAPENELDNDILHILTESSQKILWREPFPLNIADNVIKYDVNDGTADLKLPAENVKKYYEEKKKVELDILAVEKELMEKHAVKLIETDEWSKDDYEVDMVRLKRVHIFQKLSDKAINCYGLIQKEDLLPHRIIQFLDFRMHKDLHTCKAPCPHPEGEPEKEISRNKLVTKPIHSSRDSGDTIFIAEPDLIIFENFQIGHTYKKKFKLRNKSKTSQAFSFKSFPNSSHFRIEMLTKSNRLASGMCAQFNIIYSPQINCSQSSFLTFKTSQGQELVVDVLCYRDPPKLVCYLFNPVENLIKKPIPGNPEFSEKRCNALNFTIDCGACLLGSYSVVALVMANEGLGGRFFLTTENEWSFAEIEDKSNRLLELHQGCFSIFPTYFEIDHDEVGEIYIVFAPENEGLHTEKFYIICDNNSYEELEIIGDCVMFNMKKISIDLYLVENSYFSANKEMTLMMQSFTEKCFVLTVINNSALYLDYRWAIQRKNAEVDENILLLKSDWVKIIGTSDYLASYSETDFLVKIKPETKNDGRYSVFLSLYIENLPVLSMPTELNFAANSEDVEDSNYCSCVLSSSRISSSSSRTDFVWDLNPPRGSILICELEVICLIRNLVAAEEEPPNSLCKCGQLSTKSTKTQKLNLSHTYLSLGTIPVGIEIKELLTIKKLVDEPVKWILTEVEWCDGSPEQFHEICSQNLSRNHGKLCGNDKVRITYKIRAAEPLRWVSLLFLYSKSPQNEISLESICMVTYQVSKVNVNVYTETNNCALLQPENLLHVNIPEYYKIFIYNEGPSIGCFYFLKPYGPDLDKVNLKLQNSSGIIQPNELITVKLQLTPLEPGLISDIYLPCFTGSLDEIVTIKIICAVEGIRVHFYLPAKDGSYNKILWPPLQEFRTYKAPACEGECGGSLEVNWMENKSWGSLGEFADFFGENSISSIYPTVYLKEIPLKTATEMKFYIENLTPISGSFSLEAINFGSEIDCKDQLLIKAQVKPAKEIWEKLCLQGYGITIEFSKVNGKFIGHEVAELILKVYANTWGIYLEEIMVEIEDLTPFCFNLILEVVGLPLEFPFAKNTILEEPTFRFGSLTFASPPVTRQLKLANISSVPVTVNWHVFRSNSTTNLPFNLTLNPQENYEMQLDLTEAYYGHENCTEILVEPQKSLLDRNSSQTLKITLSPFDLSRTNRHFKYNLVGFITLPGEFIFKESYFKRLTGKNLGPIKLSVVATICEPLLNLDLINDETKIDIFVNDILLRNVNDFKIRLIMRNSSCTTILVDRLSAEKPFEIIKIKTPNFHDKYLENQLVTIRRNEYLEIFLNCHISKEDLMSFADFIYSEKQDEYGIVNKDLEFTCTIKKYLEISQNDGPDQKFPLFVNLFYPQINVKPAFIKFGQVLLFNTSKKVLHIYNWSGALVEIEIYKSSTSDAFVVNPNFGVIKGHNGPEDFKHCIDIFVYFTPTECMNYKEMLRITTNIPQYYLDVAVCGSGSNNEKFQVI